MEHLISFDTFRYESKTKTVSLSAYVKHKNIFYNIRTIGDHYKLINSTETSFNINNSTFHQVIYGIELPENTIIKQELVIKDNKTDKNKKFIEYFVVVNKESLDFNFGLFGNVVKLENSNLPKELEVSKSFQFKGNNK